MVNTIYLLSFVETPRKFIIAEVSIRKRGVSRNENVNTLLHQTKLSLQPFAVGPEAYMQLAF